MTVPPDIRPPRGSAPGAAGPEPAEREEFESLRSLARAKSSIVSDVVLNMTILMLAAVVLIAIFVSWTYGYMNAESAARYAPYIIIPYIIFFALTVAVYGWRLISRVIVAPLREILEATIKIAEGDLTHRISVDADNEFGLLAAAFNRMSDRLEQNRWDLLSNLEEMKRLNEHLARTQRELLSTEKLASIGRLAAGVAHEIGNPLAAITGYLEIISRRAYLEAKDREMVERIQDEVRRINDIIKELLDYSRPQDESVAELDLNESVKSSLTLLSAQRGFDRIKSRTRLLSPALVRANRSSMAQLIMNLVMNAAQAMPEGGELEIVTRPADRDGKKGVELIVRDSGAGIADENLDRIFDPFFTTKQPGQGTGLGLSICLRIVQNNSGKISVESGPGKGASFTVWLPAAAPPKETDRD
jgi:two-component system NtrC family sensor kinase